jgi:predicted phosphohydrolase
MRGMRSAVVVSVFFGAKLVHAQVPANDPQPFVPGSWTMVVLPDTQNYVASTTNAPIFTQMTNWIVANKAARNIHMVLHEGDITNNNNDVQWSRAQASMDVLNGHLPYAIVPGNHDYGSNGSANVRTTLFNNYFSFSRNPLNDPARGGTIRGWYEPGKMDNTYQVLTANDEKFLILNLEWGPRHSVVQWADTVASAHPDHKLILLTHAYLYSDETRYDWATKGASQSWNPHSYGTASDPGGTNDGQELWDKLVKKHPNFTMTFNGHVLNDQVGYLQSIGDEGNPVHQMLFNAQNDPRGGDGWLRLIEFLPDHQTAHVKTYSPFLNQWRTTSVHQFNLALSAPAIAQWNLDADGNWSAPANWQPQIVPSGSNAIASFLGKITAPRTVTLDGSRTVSALNFDNANKYTISSPTATLTLGDTTSASITVVSGGHEIDALVDVAGNTTVSVAGGAGLTLSRGFGSHAGITLTKDGDGSLTIGGAANGTPRRLQVSRGTVNLNTNQGAAAAGSMVLHINGNAGGFAARVKLGADQDLKELVVFVPQAGVQTFDLNSGAGVDEFRSVRVYSADLISAKASLAASIRNANARGAANPTDGIMDSGLDASSGIGIASKADHVLIRSTRIGDLNLDGVVSISDFIDLASNFNINGATWQEGDLNYDGSVTIADFIALASNFNASYGGGLGGASAEDFQLVADFAANVGVDGDLIGSAVPEPGMMWVVGVAALGLMSRTRRRG